MKSSRLLPVVLGICLGFTIAAAHSVFADRSQTSHQIENLPVESLHTFSEIFTRIKQNYVEEVSDEKLLEYAITGMLSGLDPHSSYLDSDAFSDLQIGTTGEFGGLGIEVSMEDGFVKVVAPIDDTPAKKAGVKSGDIIVRLDDTAVKGMTLSDAVKIMRGKPGTDIVLTIVRDSENKPLKITVVRDIIMVKSVKFKSLEPNYGYLRISQFQSHTTDDLHKAINTLLEENDNKLNGVVLDLRNNPGGVLNAAVGVSDTFLTKGMIVYTEGRQKSSELEFKARPKDLIKNTPLVVLVNSGSASASEIVAGALQDHKRAVIMGSKTFGKGSVQTILPMKNSDALKLTTARYYTPNGRSIQAQGIEPDIILEKVKFSGVDSKDNVQISEASLRGHLSNGNSKDNKEKDNKDTEKTDEIAELMDKDKEEEKSLAETDYMLYEALNLLKGLHIVSSSSH